MKIYAISLIKNEVDIIEKNLTEAAKWCDKIGGLLIENIKKMFGWKTAKLISYHTHNVHWLVFMNRIIKRVLNANKIQNYH